MKTSDRALSLLEIGKVHYRVRNNDKAINYFNRTHRDFRWTASEPKSLYYLILMYGRHNNTKKIEECYRKMGSLYKKSSVWDDAVWLTANNYFNNSKYDEAILVLNKISDIKNEFQTWAIWKLGLIFYLNKDFCNAAHHFSKLLNEFTTSGFRYPAMYWAGKSYLQMGKFDEASEFFKNGATQFPKHYYGLLCSKELQKMKKEHYRFPKLAVKLNKFPPIEVPKTITKSQTYMTIKELKKINLPNFIKFEFEFLYQQYPKEKGILYQLIKYLSLSKKHREAIYEFNKYFKEFRWGAGSKIPEEVWEIVFPSDYSPLIKKYANEHNLDIHFIMALIRQESVYDSHATSWMGARGLMQLMPDLAQKIAEKLNIKIHYLDTLYDPELNIKLGTLHLSELFIKFENKEYLVAATYNAGEERVENWWKNRKCDDSKVFIETIPYKETRLFVKNFLSSYYQYQIVYKNIK